MTSQTSGAACATSVNLLITARRWYPMHDSEPDTFVLKTMPESFADMLKEIGVQAQANEVGSLKDVEGDDYFSRYFSQAPRMITNRGTVTVQGANIEMVQIIQKG